MAAEKERSRNLSVFGLIEGQEEEFPALVTVFWKRWDENLFRNDKGGLEAETDKKKGIQRNP